MSSRKRADREDVLQSRLIWPVAAQLGEGPVWLGETGMLWFVDIKRGALHRLDPASGARETIQVGGQPSFIVPADDGTLLVGTGDAVRPLRGGVLGAPVARVEMPAHNRTNDATVDAAGRLWFGTMDDEETRPTGAVHLFDGRTVQRMGGESVITNGPAISPDGQILYHVDTLARTIWRFAIAGRDRLEHGEVFATIGEDDGTPDGVTVDAEGCVWVGLWGGWAVRRYAPDGTLIGSVALPCANATKVAFGGADLRTGYVTTARAGLSRAELAAQPLAGALFAFEAPAPGMPLPAVKLAR